MGIAGLGGPGGVDGVPEPVEEIPVTLRHRGELLDVDERAVIVERSRDMDVEMSVNPPGDPQRQGGHRHPFVGKPVGWHHTCRNDG